MTEFSGIVETLAVLLKGAHRVTTLVHCGFIVMGRNTQT